MKSPGEDLAKKMWETLTEKGIGTLLKPWIIRREGRALVDIKRLEMLQLAQTEIDVKSIHQGEKQLNRDGNLVAIDLPTSKSSKDSIEKIAISEVLKKLNSKNAAEALSDELIHSKIVLYAEDELINNTSTASEGDVSDDWLRRWKDGTKGISSENLQLLWAKILAGEFRKPGTYSLRTLEFLRNLSQEEASSIEKFGPYIINVFGIIYAEPFDLLEKKGIHIRHIIELLDLGIILYAEPKQYTIISNESESYSNLITIGNRVIQFTSEIQTRKLSFHAWCLTKLGKEIFELGKFDFNEEYFLHVANSIKSKGFVTKIGYWAPHTENNVLLYNLSQI